MESNKKISDYISSLGDWRGDVVRQIRQIIMGTEAGVLEEWKDERPFWTTTEPVCSIRVTDDQVELVFYQGAMIEDPMGLFSSGSPSDSHRSIRFKEGDEINWQAIGEMVVKAVRTTKMGIDKGE